ncbi:unnamed protein product [Amoebophrya sp. A120]|nr:unnamed protein product [Amoebophrya sp. A120]|eukprot:GSA120T00002084001.1
MDYEKALLTPRLHYGGWLLGVLIVGAGVIVPFLYMAFRDKHSIPLFDLLKRRT